MCAVSIPVDIASDVHCRCYSSEAGDGSDEQGICFDAQKHVYEGVESREGGERAEGELAAFEDPLGIDREESDCGCAGEEEAEVEAEMLCQGKQQEIKDDLRDADQSILSGMKGLAAQDFEKKIGEEDEPEEERDVVERAAPSGDECCVCR